jgi:hypothetical protein
MLRGTKRGMWVCCERWPQAEGPTMRDAEGCTRVDILHEFKNEVTIVITTISDPATRTRTTFNVRQTMAYTFHLPQLKPAPPVD